MHRSVYSCDWCGVASERGSKINRLASLSHEIVELRERIPKLWKLSRRTPPKHLADEWKKVREAKRQYDQAQNRVLEALKERDNLLALQVP